MCSDFKSAFSLTFPVAMETNQMRTPDVAMNKSQAAEELIKGLANLQQCKKVVLKKNES